MSPVWSASVAASPHPRCRPPPETPESSPLVVCRRGIQHSAPWHRSRLARPHHGQQPRTRVCLRQPQAGHQALETLAEPCGGMAGMESPRLRTTSGASDLVDCSLYPPMALFNPHKAESLHLRGLFNRSYPSCWRTTDKTLFVCEIRGKRIQEAVRMREIGLFSIRTHFTISVCFVSNF